MKFIYKVIAYVIAAAISGIIVAAIVWTAFTRAYPNPNPATAWGLPTFGFVVGVFAWVFIYAEARRRA